ncbi:tripartite-type tricarboxylate transporter receptor subunit TctC [Limimaricola soesokkakensis]|uniref:Tripartite tricarboxylate transporter family receptor n=1 Tax=Limimaricola soesokkakensis TaxID=1343159 RepID=A0A1X7A6B4_9RHOB|nr:tripartite tricarboxylate transporter substrate binding protein [Limimaricola soesokkakensis]PSK80534.1 tripartite-type tricarboxylate transporter receptor subunit TctC [Limimaricola soesokkakensis]SLN71257.1 Tripartite tricarboxylate transporter family receptor [Limimaricola soesokkakensis]
MKTLFTGALAALAFTAAPALAEYPEKEIQGIIQWGAGGSTDTVMRAVTPHAEEMLGGKVVMQNMTGGVGAIAVKFASAQDADGYTLLMGAENPLLYKVMGLGDIDYSSFVPVNVIARGVPILVANNDAPFDTLEEMVAYIQENPNEVKFGSTGPGGLPSVVTAMLQSEIELTVTAVPYDGDGPALTALQGGAIDVMPAVLGASIEAIKAGRIKPLALIDTQANEALPDVPPITEAYPAFETYLPWGPFFGVFVKEGTPDDVVAKLSEAYAAGVENADFQQLMDDRGFQVMNISGDEAQEFLDKWQSVTSWLVYDAGIAKASPEEFDIPRPE